MNAELERIYDETPPPPALSRLEPFCPLILKWRRRGHSYPAICKLLAKQGVEITREPLRQYVLRRQRARKTSVAEVAPRVEPQVDPSVVATKRTAEEKAALREAARASNYKPSFVQKEQQEFFAFDEDQPLTLKPKKEK